jgi:osmotically inducible protein OsmC
MKTLYTAVATATDGGRQGGHTRSDDGKVDFDLSVPKSMGGDDGPGTNPEQLFAAGYAACFASAVQSSAIREGDPADVEGATVTTEVSIGAMGKGRFGLAVKIDVSLPALDQEAAEDLVVRAYERCPYSNATRGNVDHAFEVKGGA